jgi:hypothetical protein
MVGISSSATGLHQERVQIAGVLPHRVGIQLPFLQNDTDLWYLVPADISNRPRAAATNFMLGRLRSGVTVAQAEAELTVIASRLAERYAIDRGKRPLVQSLEAIAQGPVRQTMGLLSLGVLLVFLVGLLNLASHASRGHRAPARLRGFGAPKRTLDTAPAFHRMFLESEGKKTLRPWHIRVASVRTSAGHAANMTSALVGARTPRKQSCLTHRFCYRGLFSWLGYSVTSVIFPA